MQPVLNTGHFSLAAAIAAAVAFAALWLRSRRALAQACGERAAEADGRAKAEERLALSRELFDRLPVALFLVTPDHRIVILNKATEAIAGMPREDILREGCFGLFCDNKTHYEKCPGHASLFSGEDWDGEADIGGRHYQVHVRPLRLGGEIPYSLVSLMDHTEQEKQQNERQAVVERLERLLARSDRLRQCLADFATIQDPDRVLASALNEGANLFNAGSAYLIRLEPDGSLRRVHSFFRSPEFDSLPLDAANSLGIHASIAGLQELFYDQGSSTEHPAIDALLLSARAKRLAGARIEVDGIHWGYVGFLLDRPSLAPDEEHTLLRSISFLCEIAVRRSNLINAVDSERQRLMAATAAAKNAAKAKTMFLATISHEIRTPLNAIVGYGELLSSPDLKPESVHEYTNGISRASSALLNLVNDVLDIIKFDAKGSDMKSGTCDLVALSSEMDAIFRWRAANKGLEIRYSIPAGFPILHLSERRMRQILVNLVGNAVKFTQSGYVEWSASSEPDGNGTVALSIDVRDTGIGVSPERRESIFDPFVQDISTRGGHIYEGTGLGLSIVKRLVTSCDGTIHVEDNPGGGSLFRLRIPGVGTEAPAAPASSSPAAPDGGAQLDLPPGFRVLLADDVPVNLRVLALYLNALGIRDIDTAPSGRTALAALRAHPASIVFTDLWMADGSGAELARAMRADPELAAIPVIAVTADSEASSTFDPDLFQRTLAKPITAAKLREAIAATIPRLQPTATDRNRPQSTATEPNTSPSHVQDTHS